MAVPKPAVVTEYRSPNKNGYAGAREVQAVAWHVTDGGFSGSLSWLCNPESQASANYLLDKDGTLYELVPPDDSAWTNGAVMQPDMTNPVIAGWIHAGTNPNLRTVTVEVVREDSAMNQPGGWTDAQVQSLCQLTAWVCDHYRLPPDRTHVIRHAQIDSVNRYFCPGCAESEMTAWIADIASYVRVCSGGGTATLPPAGTATQFLTARGELVAVVNFGGEATRLLGVAYADVGGSVIGMDGATYDRSLLAGVMQPWVKRPAP